ncbi:2221_t:CDS:2 [Ambispora leptoticha]|uniref:2221_t:CDS:1 n=1 Tax=Ambispora leptoticha TaxID=144679 RepID=A0A9N9BT14_9GLOM|nr:2221_t:CDS:2 [Ambispora leptoticha]
MSQVGFFTFLIYETVAVCDYSNISACTCDKNDKVGDLKCGHELNNVNCPYDPGFIFQCNPGDTSICKYVGVCLHGCCSTGDGYSHCCADQQCTGCPSGNFHPNPSNAPLAAPDNPNTKLKNPYSKPNNPNSKPNTNTTLNPIADLFQHHNFQQI